MDWKGKAYEALGKIYEKVSGEKPQPYKGSSKEAEKETSSSNESSAPLDKLDDLKGKLLDIDKKKFIIAGIGLVAVIVAFCAISAVKTSINNRPTKVYLNSIVTFSEPEGMNGYGTITCAVDTGKLLSAMYGTLQMPDQSNQDAYNNALVIKQQREAAVEEAGKYIVVTVDKTEKLSNGDTVNATVSFQTEGASQFPSFIFAEGISSYTVEGLTNGNSIKPFDANLIKMKVDGLSGSATATLDIKKNDYTYYLNYDWSPKTNLSNGDTITVTISPNADKLKDIGYAVPEEQTWEYKVSGLSRPLNSQDELPDVVLDEMYIYADKLLKQEYNAIKVDDNDLVVQTPTINNMYWIDLADKRTPLADYLNDIYLYNAVVISGYFRIDSIDEAAAEGEEAAVTNIGGYYAFVFQNVVIDPDNSCSYDKAEVAEIIVPANTEDDFFEWMQNYFKNCSIARIGRK